MPLLPVLLLVSPSKASVSNATAATAVGGGGGLWAPNRTRLLGAFLGQDEPDEGSTRAPPYEKPPAPTPNIANIRHHRSRRVFVRTTTARSAAVHDYQDDETPKMLKQVFQTLNSTQNSSSAPLPQEGQSARKGSRGSKFSASAAARRTSQENQLGRRLGESLAINNADDGDESTMLADDGRVEKDYEMVYPTNHDYSASAAPPPHAHPQNTQDLDIVSKFLRFIEANSAENCTAGTDLKLGQGIVDRYAQERFRLEAELAVNRANMLTRIWKYAPSSMESEYLLHAAVISLVEFDDDIFAGGNCYDKGEYKNYTLFCPFAYRLPEGRILVKDLAVEYKYLSDTSEFFWAARKKAERVISNFSQFSRAYHQYPFNDTAHLPGRDLDEILNVTYEDGKWSEPYFDCGGGDIWMMTYTVPFFGYRGGAYFFKGTSGIDIDLRRVDIDQCYANPGELNLFANSNKCKNATTQCVPIKGLGFRRGSYKCECRRGFYFPNVTSTVKYFNGSLLEEEYENKFHSKLSRYDDPDAFECLPCPVDCEQCEDDRPCVVTLNWVMRTAILILQGAIILMLPIVGLFTWRYSEVKVVRAASPVLLRFIVLGAFFIYCTTLVMYPTPSLVTCTLRVWLREVGFSLAYGALMLKTWRISVIFRVRSAKAVKITDLDLMKRLGVIVAMFTALLVIRTLVSPPHSVVSYTAQDLKAWLCESDWWDHSFTIMELSLLVWGIRLCIVVRKAPSEFNESKFISLAIYNEFLLSLFLNISMLFLQSPANPDLLYIIFFCHVQLTMTLLLCLIFGSKAYMVLRSGDKASSSDDPGRPANSKFLSKSRSQSTQHKHGGPNSMGGGQQHGVMNHSASNQLTNSALVSEEFHRIYLQLEELKKQNLKLGEIALVGKIIAMQEAANKIIIQTSAAGKQQQQQPTPAAKAKAMETEQFSLQAQLHETLLAPQNLQVPGQSGTGSGRCSGNLYTNAAVATFPAGSSVSTGRKKSIVLSNISEEELAPPSHLLVETRAGTKDNNPATAEPNHNSPTADPSAQIPSPSSENEVQVGDEDAYMDAVEEEDDDDGNFGGSGGRLVLALVPRASEESGSEDGRKPRPSRSESGSGKKRKYTKEDTIEFIDEGEDVVVSDPLATSTAPPNSTQSTADPEGKGPDGGDGKKKRVLLDLDDKSRFTEEITV